MTIYVPGLAKNKKRESNAVVGVAATDKLAAKWRQRKQAHTASAVSAITTCTT